MLEVGGVGLQNRGSDDFWAQDRGIKGIHFLTKLSS